MEDKLTRTEKKKLESELRRKGVLHMPLNKHHRNCLEIFICDRCTVDLCAQYFNSFHVKHVHLYLRCNIYSIFVLISTTFIV